MRVWRLAAGPHREIDGEGSRIYGGRWNSPGIPVVYTATHVSLALLEQLVHVEPEDLPDAVRAFVIDLPDDVVTEVVAQMIRPGDVETCRRYGDEWAESRRSAALVVPSTLVAAELHPGSIETEERNVLLNPRHPMAASWRMVETSFSVDARLKRTG
jgi:RES domain-containing protein